jgi:hypothetical protein
MPFLPAMRPGMKSISIAKIFSTGFNAGDLSRNGPDIPSEHPTIDAGKSTIAKGKESNPFKFKGIKNFSDFSDFPLTIDF